MSVAAPAGVVSASQQRNAPCPCGSGLRYKHCCGSATSARPASRPPVPYEGWEALDGAEQAELWRAMQEALVAQKSRRFDVAARLYETVIARAPLTYDAVHMLGVVRLEQGDLAHAEALLTRALDLMPGLEAIRQNVGVLEHRKREYRGLDSAHATIAYDMLRLYGYGQRGRLPVTEPGFPIPGHSTDPGSVVHVVVPGDASNAASNRSGVALFETLRRTRTTLLWSDPGAARWLAPIGARKIDVATNLMPHSGTLALFGISAPTLQWLPHAAAGFNAIVVAIDVQDPVLYVELFETLPSTVRERVRFVSRSREALEELGLRGTFDPMLFESIGTDNGVRHGVRKGLGVFLPAVRDGLDGERWQILEWLRGQGFFLRLLYPGRLPSPHVPSEDEHLVSLVTDWDGWRRGLDALVFWGAGGRMRQFDRLVFEAAAAELRLVADGFGDYASAVADRANCRLFFGATDLRRGFTELMRDLNTHASLPIE